VARGPRGRDPLVISVEGSSKILGPTPTNCCPRGRPARRLAAAGTSGASHWTFNAGIVCSLPSSTGVNDTNGVLRLTPDAPLACDLLAGPASLLGNLNRQVTCVSGRYIVTAQALAGLFTRSLLRPSVMKYES
jgi:hypothetical protein